MLAAVIKIMMDYDIDTAIVLFISHAVFTGIFLTLFAWILSEIFSVEILNSFSPNVFWYVIVIIVEYLLIYAVETKYYMYYTFLSDYIVCAIGGLLYACYALYVVTRKKNPHLQRTNRG